VSRENGLSERAHDQLLVVVLLLVLLALMGGEHTQHVHHGWCLFPPRPLLRGEQPGRAG